MKHKGFSTLELMIAFAIGSLIIVAVVSIAFGAQYWLIASRTSGEGLYKAKTMLEDLRSASRLSFQLASSTPYRADESCVLGQFCYYLESIVTDLSPCSKEVEAHVEWRVENYGTTSSALYTSLADPNAIVALGSDCPLAQPAGDWNNTDDDDVNAAFGTVTGIDVFNGITYITSATAPFLYIVDSGGVVSFANSFTETVPLNAIDVVREQTTGRIFAYVAREDGDGQLGVIDVTNPENPVLASPPYKLEDSSNEGWRVFVYDRVAYVSTFDVGGREFSAVDVATPSFPKALGSADINTTAYGIVVRDERVGSEVRRLAYLVTTSDNRVLQVLDVQDPSSMFERASGPSGVTKDGRSLFLSGNKAYVGFESGTGDDLYVFDIRTLSGGFPTLSSKEIGGHASAVRVSGDFAYIARTSGTSELIVLNSETLEETTDASISNIGHTALDIEGDIVYVGASGGVHEITSP